MQLIFVAKKIKFKFYLESVKSTSLKNPPCHADTIIHSSGNIDVILLFMKFVVEPRNIYITQYLLYGEVTTSSSADGNMLCVKR